MTRLGLCIYIIENATVLLARLFYHIKEKCRIFDILQPISISVEKVSEHGFIICKPEGLLEDEFVTIDSPLTINCFVAA